jgi:hypothetical protein
MADKYAVTLKADGSASVDVTWDIAGLGLAACCAANSTRYELDAAGGPWTEAGATAAVAAQSAADKATWAADQIASGMGA